MPVREIIPLLPVIVLAASSVIVMIGIGLRRSHLLTSTLTAAGLIIAMASIPFASTFAPKRLTALLIIDRYALFYTGLILAATLVTSLLSYGYFEKRGGRREEVYLLLLLASLGSVVIVSASHLASIFLGIEILSVSLYSLIASLRETDRGVEAAVKYLVLAGVSSAFILFGMALIYGGTGSMEIGRIASRAGAAGEARALLFAGTALFLTGLGFKLAIAPFHLWTPDVYEGAPSPVTGFVATASKGAVFALLLRFFGAGIAADSPLFMVFTVIAAVSMLWGNLLALLQQNMKRLLAYSSISHMGYLLVAFLAGGRYGFTAAAFYLTAYFVTILGAFGVISLLSDERGEAETMDHFRGLAWRRPWMAAVFTGMILSLAGIPLTAGFMGKFMVLAAGIQSGLWFLVITLVAGSVIGLFYYLRVVQVMFRREGETEGSNHHRIPLGGAAVMAVLTILLIWLGVNPGPLMEMIQRVAVLR